MGFDTANTEIKSIAVKSDQSQVALGIESNEAGFKRILPAASPFTNPVVVAAYDTSTDTYDWVKVFDDYAGYLHVEFNPADDKLLVSWRDSNTFVGFIYIDPNNGGNLLTPQRYTKVATWGAASPDSYVIHPSDTIYWVSYRRSDKIFEFSRIILSTTAADLTASCTTQNFSFKAYNAAATPHLYASAYLSTDNANLITLASGEQGLNGAYCRLDFWNAATGAHRLAGTSTAAENSVDDIICRHPTMYANGAGYKVSLVYHKPSATLG